MQGIFSCIDILNFYEMEAKEESQIAVEVQKNLIISRRDPGFEITPAMVQVLEEVLGESTFQKLLSEKKDRIPKATCASPRQEKCFDFKPFWISVYKVGRSYGGPEEGGWWYDHHYRCESRMCKREEIQGVKNLLGKEYEDHSDYHYPDRYEILIIVEDVKGENETISRPYYE